MKDGRMLFLNGEFLEGKKAYYIVETSSIERVFRPITIEGSGDLTRPEALAPISKAVQTKTN